MDGRKRNKLKGSGWVIGSVRDFLKLSEVEATRVEGLLKMHGQQKRTFFELADQLATSVDASEKRRLKRKLARMTYGA